MDAAKFLNAPPWRVVGGTKTLWFARWEALREIEIKLADRQRREAERQKKK